jgi:hypothetical protein
MATPFYRAAINEWLEALCRYGQMRSHSAKEEVIARKGLPISRLYYGFYAAAVAGAAMRCAEIIIIVKFVVVVIVIDMRPAGVRTR